MRPIVLLIRLICVILRGIRNSSRVFAGTRVLAVPLQQGGYKFGGGIMKLFIFVLVVAGLIPVSASAEPVTPIRMPILGATTEGLTPYGLIEEQESHRMRSAWDAPTVDFMTDTEGRQILMISDGDKELLVYLGYTNGRIVELAQPWEKGWVYNYPPNPYLVILGPHYGTERESGVDFRVCFQTDSVGMRYVVQVVDFTNRVDLKVYLGYMKSAQDQISACRV